jgi:hypothetical protein
MRHELFRGFRFSSQDPMSFSHLPILIGSACSDGWPQELGSSGSTEGKKKVTKFPPKLPPTALWHFSHQTPIEPLFI